MSLRLLLVATLAAAGACAHAPRGEPDAPLAARLGVSASGMDVGLNDDAHIAVFAVTPGRGVTLVYPLAHEHTRFVAGWSTVAHNPAGRAVSYEPRLARFMSPSASTVLVLVASREPIDVRRFATGSSLERALGDRVYRSYDADAVIGGITRLAVPDVRDEDWAMDVTAIPVTRHGAGYALLDEGRYPLENPYVTVYCSTPGATGRVVVHVEFARYACAPADPPADSTATAGTGTGTSAVRAPVTRRTFASADAEAAEPAAAGVQRERTDAARERAREAAERQTERRVRPRSSAEGAGAAGRTRGEGAARGTGERVRGERSGTGARTPTGGRGARQP